MAKPGARVRTDFGPIQRAAAAAASIGDARILWALLTLVLAQSATLDRFASTGQLGELI